MKAGARYRKLRRRVVAWETFHERDRFHDDKMITRYNSGGMKCPGGKPGAAVVKGHRNRKGKS